MKCFFCFSGKDRHYQDMAKVLVYSAQRNTELELYCVYDEIDTDFLKWLVDKGVIVLKWTVTFWNDLKRIYSGNKSLEFCRGTYLCSELPRIVRHYGINDECILYVDVDVMFLRNPTITIKPTLLGVPNDFSIEDKSRFSTGVIVMNVDSLLSYLADFQKHLKLNCYNFEFAKMGPCDQGAWNTFFTNKNDWLSPLLDWKCWWGINKDANLIHFSGPKPVEIDRLLRIDDGAIKNLTPKEYLNLTLVNLNKEAFKYYLHHWNDYFSFVQS